MSYLSITTPEFSVKIILEAALKLNDPPFILDWDTPKNISIFLSNVESAIAYYLQQEADLKVLDTTATLQVTYMQRYGGDLFGIQYHDKYDKVEVYRREFHLQTKLGHECNISYPDCVETYPSKIQDLNKKIPLEILPTLINTPYKNFALSKLQGLV